MALSSILKLFEPNRYSILCRLTNILTSYGESISFIHILLLLSFKC